MDQGDGQFDFDGASNGASGAEAQGFGAGWEDDLETMLLKGMKKKAQRRIAIMAGMMVIGVLIGALWASVWVTVTNDGTAAGPAAGATGCVGAACRACRPMHGGHMYDGWSIGCSGGPNVDCDACYGGIAPGNKCPHDCMCTVDCDHSRGWDMNEQVRGDDSSYMVRCDDGRWVGESCAPGVCTNLCLDHDDCASNPCNTGTCHDALQNYTCTCHPGFSGEHCEIDANECQDGLGSAGPADSPVCASYATTFSQAAAAGVGPCSAWTAAQMSAVVGVLQPPVPAGQTLEDLCPQSCSGTTAVAQAGDPCHMNQPGSGTVKCIESGGTHTLSNGMPATGPFEQPPAGYPQYDASKGAFEGGRRYVCVCSSTNASDAWNTRTKFGDTCSATSDACDCAANPYSAGCQDPLTFQPTGEPSPCQNGAECTDGTGFPPYTCACPGGYSGPNCEVLTHSNAIPLTATQITATAVFNQDGVIGSITMTQDAHNPTAPTAVSVSLRGLDDMPNPWHVHEYPPRIPGVCNSTSTGGHFLANSKDHADIWNLGGNMEDLGSTAAPDAPAGLVNYTGTDATLPLSGDQSVVGKSIVIHKKTGNAPWVCAPILQVGAGSAAGGEGCGTMASHFSGQEDQFNFVDGDGGSCSGAAGEVCQVHCKDGYQTSGTTDYTCSAAGAWDPDPDTSCTDIDECAEAVNPCQNGAACSESKSDGSIAIGDYHCECPDGFRGQNCETTTSECDNSPCTHGGTCVDGEGGTYTCACATGYEGENCGTDTDECAAGPCLNGGECADSNTNKHDIAPGAFSCTCVGTFSGDTCESAMDHCSPNPCLNGGGCTTTADAHTCDCPGGTEGDNCETDIDECASEPCQNSGTCLTSGGLDMFLCTCGAGFHGEMCEATEDNCASAPCQNAGSVCETTAEAYTCTCAAGFAGENCADADPCATTSCENGGTCDGSSGAAVCTCALGWSGDTCESDTDDCASGPCEHGVCTDGLNSYTCACDDTHTGDNCADDKDLCDPNPCENEGSCANDGGAAVCTCAAGWNGETCSSDIDECASTPCQNGGDCSQGADSYTCSCAAGFGGANCQCGATDKVDGDSCSACGDGKQPNEDQSACQNCPERQAGTGGSCAQCDAGKSPATASAATECSDCAAGTAGTDGSCSACGAGKQPDDGRQNCVTCPAGMASTAGTCEACGAGTHPNGGHTECEACAAGKAGDDGACSETCTPGQEPSEDRDRCVACGDGLYSADGAACLACPDGQAPAEDKGSCMAASAVGESGTCDLTGAAYCLVITDMQLSAPIPNGQKKGFPADAVEVFVYDVVTECDGTYDGCDDPEIVDLADDEIGVAAIPKHGDQTTFTVEFGLPTGVSQCDEVLALLNAEIADASSTLMTDTAVTEILTTLVTPQDLNSRCIDTTAEGRR